MPYRQLPLLPASLADYLDCPRRFQLRYLLEQAWPAVESEPLLERERLADLGRRFHKLIQQHVEGLSAETLTESIGEPELARWWQSYLDSLATTLSDLPEGRRAEVAMSIPIHSYRLAAHFDLIASDDDRAVIVDWKTEQRQPAREQLLQRVQTRVYRYVLTAGAAAPARHRVDDLLVRAVSRSAGHPALRRRAARGDHQYLSELIEEIENLARDSQRLAGFRMAENTRRAQVRLLRLSLVVQSRRARRHQRSRRGRLRSGRAHQHRADRCD